MIPPRHVYNCENNLDNWFAALSSLDEVIDLVFIGDSITAGTGAGETLDDYKNKSYVGLTRIKFHNQFENTGQGFVAPYWHDPSTIQQMTIGEGWERWLNKGMLESYSCHTPNSIITIPFAGTGIRLYYYQGSTQYPPGTFTTQIDGGGVVAHDCAGIEDGTHHIDLTGLENTTHTLILTYTGTTNQYMLFEGATELNEATVGVKTNCVGHAGASAWLYFDKVQAYVDSCVDAFNAPLYCVCIGVNDYAEDGSRMEAFVSGLQKLITKIKSVADCILIIPITPTIFDKDVWDEYRQEYYRLGFLNGCGVIDFGERYNSNESSYLIDEIHPSPLGHSKMSYLIYQVLHLNPDAVRTHVTRRSDVAHRNARECNVFW